MKNVLPQRELSSYIEPIKMKESADSQPENIDPMQTLDPIFRPKSIAVVGASSKDKSIGKEIIHNLIEYEFQGPIFPVNPNAQVVHSIKCYKSVLKIPDPVDLAIVVVPASGVLDVVRECGQKGVRGIVVITAGFNEIGGVGKDREKELLEIVERHQMRMIGPNCMGVINTNSLVKMDATFAPALPKAGRIGFMSQSGALGVAILDIATNLDLGISMFVSMGNKADVSGNDLLMYWKDDPETQLILMYLESFGNPRKFTRIAKSITKTKPIICVKSGRTLQGASAASSHTGAIASSLDVAVDALFDKCGVIRVSTIDELFNLAQAFDSQPIPKGNRVAIITNAGGPAIMATDAVVNSGLTLAKLSDATKKQLRDFLPQEANVNNPVDMIASANEHSYKKALTLVLSDDNVDSAIVIFVPPIMINSDAVAASIVETNSQFPGKTILTCFMGQQEALGAIKNLRRNKIPVYSFPESAVYGLTAMQKYAEWKKRPETKIREFDVDKTQVIEMINRLKFEGRTQLHFSEVKDVLTAYGFPVADSIIAPLNEKKEILEFAKAHDAVVLKLIAPTLTHKSDLGAVKVDLRNEKDIQKALEEFDQICEKHKIKPQGVLIQEMLKGGKELVLGMNLDKDFGPLIMFGLGGIYVEVLKDVTFNIAPLDESEAREMVESIKSFPLLKGVRGETPVSIEAVCDALQRLSQLVTDFPEIKEIDMNPFMAFSDPRQCKVVDARITLTN